MKYINNIKSDNCNEETNVSLYREREREKRERGRGEREKREREEREKRERERESLRIGKRDCEVSMKRK